MLLVTYITCNSLAYDSSATLLKEKYYLAYKTILKLPVKICKNCSLTFKVCDITKNDRYFLFIIRHTK